MPAEEEPAPMERRDNESPLQLCVKWNNYQANLMSSFEQLLKNQSFVDVTLACDGQSLKAHKVVLSACSPYFETLFMDNPCRHPIIIMRDIKFADLQAIVDFMYRGEINISQEQLTSFLKVAETLKVRGLTDVTEDYSVSSSGIRRRPSKRRPSDAESPPRARRRVSLEQSPGRSPPRAPSTPPRAATTEPLPPPENSHPTLPPLHPDDVDIRPGIAEMIREEERAKLKHNRAWLGSPLPSTSSLADSYQYQLQSMYQNCWTTNQGLVHNLRFRERGPLKSWRPETMAEAIISVLKEGLSLSQAARKYDIPYPTFVLYANRVHNMLGPSADGGADLRPKGRGRPQRILLGVWPDNTIREVIRAVVFRDMNTPLSHRRDDVLPYPALTDGTSDAHAPCGNGRDEGVPVSAATATAAAVAAVAYSLRHQMVGAAQRPQDHPHLGLPSLPLQSPCLFSPISEGLESPLCSPPPPGHALEPPRERFHHPFVTSTQIQGSEMGPPKAPLAKNGKDGMSTPVSVTAESPPVDSPSPKIF